MGGVGLGEVGRGLRQRRGVDNGPRWGLMDVASAEVLDGGRVTMVGGHSPVLRLDRVSPT
jgi:hypothetical protein